MVAELRVLKELKRLNLSCEESSVFSKNCAVIQRGLLQAFIKHMLFYKLVHRLKKEEPFNVLPLADKDYDALVDILRAFKELEVLEYDLEDGMLRSRILQREFFGRKTLRRSLKTLFTGITAYRTMLTLKKAPFKVVFNVKRNDVKLYDVALLTDEKCLFFNARRPPENSLSLSIPYKVYSLAPPVIIQRFKDNPTVVNVLKVRWLIEKEFNARTDLSQKNFPYA